jgi:hypothetical protein
MKNHLRLAVVMTAAIGLAACESDFHHHGGPYAGVEVGYVDGYYDDAYGPVYDGYWGDGDVFYYRGSADGEYRRDDAHHFSRGAGNGFHQMHMRAGHAAPAAHAG